MSYDITGVNGFVVWFIANGGATFDNAVFDVTVENTTMATEAARDSTISVSGTTPIVSAIPGVRYVCSDTLSELTFTPSETGVCSVCFTAGSSMAMSIPNTVKMPEWWTGVEEGRTYEISIADGVYGVVTSWT